MRQRAEAVDQLGGEQLDVAVVLDFREPPIERKPHWQVGDVILRDQHRRADGDLRRPFFRNRRADAGLHAQNRLLQHLLVKLVADFLDMAGLLLAKEVAGAADVEIVRGKLKTGAQRVERLQHF